LANGRKIVGRLAKVAEASLRRRLSRPAPFHSRLPGFDPVFYTYWYKDVRAAGIDPLEHYLQLGWKEGRDPCAGFSTNGYLAANPDVRASGINPLLHFLDSGIAEARGGWQKDPLQHPGAPGTPEVPMKLLAPPRGATNQEADSVDPTGNTVPLPRDAS
jgi:hypothetical protein